MGIRVMKEASNSRTAGYSAVVTQGVPETIIPGIACNLVDNATITKSDGTTEVTIGLALDSNVLYPIGNLSPDTQAGDGYDYINYNRQGLISLFSNGEVELYDDKRIGVAGVSHPANFAEAFAVNAPVYADAVGKITLVNAGSAPQIGVVTGVTNPQTVALVLRLKIK